MNCKYETVFILTPVLSGTQMKDAVTKFKKILEKAGAKISNEENWGLKKLAYPILHKKTGFFNLFEFDAPPTAIAALELEFKRDETIMRWLTVKLDKYAVEYNEKRKSGAFKKKSEPTEAVKEEAKK